MNAMLLVYAIFALGVCLAVALYWTDRIRRREAVYRWSANNGLKLLSFRKPLVTEASKFPFSLSKSQHVFRIKVETSTGDSRSGWLRVGSAWLGLTSDAADVKWDIATS